MASRSVKNAHPARSRLFAGMFVAAAAVALAVAPLDEARATSFAELTTEQFTDASDYIVRGVVQEVWTELDNRGRVWTRARVQVSETLKGRDVPAEIVIDSMGGTYGDVTLEIEGRAVFSEQEELLVFLTETTDGRLVPVSKFLGKYTIRRAPGETRHHVMQYHPRAGLRFDARFLPHPPPEDRVYLDDLVSRIRDRVERGWDGQPVPGIRLDRLERINTPDRRMPR